MDDDLHGNNGGMHNGGGVQDPNHSMHVQYDHHGMMDEQHADDVMNEGLEADIPSHLGNTSDHRGEVVDRGSENGDQLTLSFQGQVYVFDRVLPEKVTSLLLAAGWCFFFLCNKALVDICYCRFKLCFCYLEEGKYQIQSRQT